MNRYDLILSGDTFSTIFDGKETKLKQINGLLGSTQNLVNTKKSKGFSKMMKMHEKMEFRVQFQNNVKNQQKKI